MAEFVNPDAFAPFADPPERRAPSGHAALSEATAEETWKGALPPGTEWNYEAGDLAGVVSLRAISGQEVEARDALTAATVTVTATLRRALPDPRLPRHG